jgi:hypothetical protein
MSTTGADRAPCRRRIRAIVDVARPRREPREVSPLAEALRSERFKTGRRHRLERFAKANRARRVVANGPHRALKHAPVPPYRGHARDSKARGVVVVHRDASRRRESKRVKRFRRRGCVSRFAVSGEDDVVRPASLGGGDARAR